MVIAEPALPEPMNSRSPIAVPAPSATTAAPSVTARVFASTRCRRGTTCGSATDRLALMNRLTPATSNPPT